MTATGSYPEQAFSPAEPDFQPRPARPRAGVRSMFLTHRLLDRNRLWYALASFIEARPTLYKGFTWAEEKAKHWLFGCRMCGQCALPVTAYSCPQSCPKQLRNGPCGGVYPDGRCEVYPELRCVWVIAYERAEKEGKITDLRRLVRPIDHRRWGQSSWINFWRGRDERLWTRSDPVARGEHPDL